MAHFAELDENNVVLRVIVIRNEDMLDENGQESEELGIEVCKQICGANTNWKQTSYNNNLRKRYAAEGFIYLPEFDVFTPPKLFNSWVLNQQEFYWEAPVPMPEDGQLYKWDEDTISWVLAESE